MSIFHKDFKMNIEELTLEEIKEVMKDRSIHKMSLKSGISVTALYKIIKGQENFQCSTLSRLSKFLLKEYPESAWYLGGIEQKG